MLTTTGRSFSRRRWRRRALLLSLWLAGWVAGSGQNLGPSFQPDTFLRVPVTDGPVYAIALDAQSVYIGGAFSHVDGEERSNLAAFDLLSGELDPDWRPTVNGVVRALAVQPGGAVYAGGQFGQVNGAARARLAALEPAHANFPGRTVEGWSAEVNDGVVEALAVGNEALYVGGSFTQAGGVERNCLAAFYPALPFSSGGLIALWNPNVRGDAGPASVKALAVTVNRIYAGGIYFDTVNDEATRRNLAAFQPASPGSEGLVEESWDPGLPADAQVYALMAGIDRLYVGGSWLTPGPGPRQCLLSIPFPGGGNHGQADPNWHPAVEGVEPPVVHALALLGRRIYIGGHFDKAGGQPRANLAAVAPADDPFAGESIDWDWPVTGTPAAVYALRPLQARLFFGGTFVRVAGVEQANLAELAATVAYEFNAVEPAGWLGYDGVNRWPDWRK